jgi:hypothetical protein
MHSYHIVAELRQIHGASCRLLEQFPPVYSDERLLSSLASQLPSSSKFQAVRWAHRGSAMQTSFLRRDLVSLALSPDLAPRTMGLPLPRISAATTPAMLLAAVAKNVESTLSHVVSRVPSSDGIPGAPGSAAGSALPARPVRAGDAAVGSVNGAAASISARTSAPAVRRGPRPR